MVIRLLLLTFIFPPFFPAAELDEFLNEILLAHDRGVSVLKNSSSNVRNWNFGQSFFFSGTIITTIGKTWTFNLFTHFFFLFARNDFEEKAELRISLGPNLARHFGRNSNLEIPKF